MIRNTGRAQCAHTADPCNKAAGAQKRIEHHVAGLGEALDQRPEDVDRLLPARSDPGGIQGFFEGWQALLKTSLPSFVDQPL